MNEWMKRWMNEWMETKHILKDYKTDSSLTFTVSLSLTLLLLQSVSVGGVSSDLTSGWTPAPCDVRAVMCPGGSLCFPLRRRHRSVSSWGNESRLCAEFMFPCALNFDHERWHTHQLKPLREHLLTSSTSPSVVSSTLSSYLTRAHRPCCPEGGREPGVGRVGGGVCNDPHHKSHFLNHFYQCFQN